MFLKILLIVIIIISLLFLSFSFKLVINKKQQLPKTSDEISGDMQTNLKNQKDLMQNRNQHS
jgi:hypothetical protein